jgi:hypothetical protein
MSPQLLLCAKNVPALKKKKKVLCQRVSNHDKVLEFGTNFANMDTLLISLKISKCRVKDQSFTISVAILFFNI